MTLIYIPGYRTAKVFVVVVGLSMLLAGCINLLPLVMLCLAGSSAQAQVIKIEKEEPGGKKVVFTDDMEFGQEQGFKDYNVSYWDYCNFTTKLNLEYTFRLPVGSKIKPLFPMRDRDNLPTTIFVKYNPDNPDSLVCPFIIGTWFVPCSLTFLGLLCTLIGAALLRNARKPIEVLVKQRPI